MKLTQIIIFTVGVVTGDQYVRTNRIVGGSEVWPPFKYPWMVSLKRYGHHSCGGAQYNGNTVISAAHCVIGPESSWTAELHRHRIRLPIDEEYGESYRIKSAIAHPRYRSISNAYDVAVWKLDNIPDNKELINLDSGNRIYRERSSLLVMGWGTLASGGSISSVLREVAVPIVPISECKQLYPRLHTPSQFCAGVLEGGKDSCQGDSGGPIIAFNDSKPILMGVVSWGEGCASRNRPGVYTRIAKVIDFIGEHSK